MRELFDSFATFDDFLAYLAVSLALLAAFVAIYIRVTPYREIALIREGNMAAAYSLSGSILGFVIPLTSAIQHSVGLADMAIWGAIALAVQVAAFIVARILFPAIVTDIPAGKQAQGFMAGALALAVGLLNAACMTY
jgi:putative membrane protein